MRLKKSRFPSTASMLFVLITFVVLLISWSSPLLGTPTTEAALFLGVFLAPAAFLAGICRGAGRYNYRFKEDLFQEGSWVFISVIIYSAILWLRSFSFKSCGSDNGLVYFFILLFPQLFLNLVSGICLGRWVGHIKRAVILGVFVCLIYLLFQVWWWWEHPSLRFFDLYWFSITGDLLAGQSISQGLLGYRVAALLYGSSLLLLTASWKNQLYQKFWALILLFCAVIIQYKSYHWISPGDAQRMQDYPDLLAEGPLRLHTNVESIGKEQAEAILQEGIFWLERLKNRTGIDPKNPIHIWLYSNAASLQRYTGAQNVHFALPVQRQIHMIGTEIPHPTLGHELAHVLVGQKSKTIWGVPGIWKIVPNWGLSEGLATYLTPELNLHDDLSTQEQAVALYRLGLEKYPEDLFSIEPWYFWVQSSRRAYTASAAILENYINTQCQTLDCRFKLIGDMVEAGEVKWLDSFVKKYREFLRTTMLFPDAMPSVERRYKPESILLADCSLKKQLDPEEILEKEHNIILLPISKQREREIQRVLSANSSIMSYARAGLLLLKQASKSQDLLGIAALYGNLGFTLGEASEENHRQAYDFSAYLLARAEILSGHFQNGLEHMPPNLEAWVGQESRRLIALAHAQLGYFEQAVQEFEALRNQAVRPADRIRFADMAERSMAMALGKKFLLGVWAHN